MELKYSSAIFAGLLGTLWAMPAMAQKECGVTATIDLTLPTCGEYANGAVTVNVSGGVGTYTFYLNGFEFAGPTATGLISGSYSYWVVDEADCWFKSDFYLDCEPEEVNCEFRTQTQGGWGATPNGNNPAAYLQSHFASCFPNGITIGCVSNNTLTLTTSTAVKNFLPSGSTPSLLPNDMVNPGGGYNNVLAGQLVAATINITVDQCDPNFSAATGWLGDATYAGGTFAGWTVAEVISAANQFIGGCGGSYSASQFNEALTTLNENYVGGTVNKGNIDCGDKKMLGSTITTTMRIFPNPAVGSATVEISSATGGTGTLRVLDLTGRTVMQQRVSNSVIGVKTMNVELGGLTAGTYVLSLDLNGTVTTTRLVVNK